MASIPPEVVAAMAAALDRSCLSPPSLVKDDEELRRKLARAIIQLVDKGERAPERPSELEFEALLVVNGD